MKKSRIVTGELTLHFEGVHQVCKLYESAPEMFEQCTTQRLTFGGMTTALGNSFFLNSQREACQCYPDTQAARGRYHDSILSLHQVQCDVRQGPHAFDAGDDTRPATWAQEMGATLTLTRGGGAQKYRSAKATPEFVEDLMARYRGKEGELLYQLTRRYAKSEVLFDDVKDEL
jgi:hypothetical protein